MTRSIDAERLTTFEVNDDGTRVRLNGTDAEGGVVSMSLPADCMRQMVLTLPRIAQEALRLRHGDQNLRVVYPTSTWKVQKSGSGEEIVILTLATADGFEISFGFDAWRLRSFETSIRTAVELTSRAAELN